MKLCDCAGDWDDDDLDRGIRPVPNGSSVPVKKRVSTQKLLLGRKANISIEEELYSMLPVVYCIPLDRALARKTHVVAGGGSGRKMRRNFGGKLESTVHVAYQKARYFAPPMKDVMIHMNFIGILSFILGNCVHNRDV